MRRAIFLDRDGVVNEEVDVLHRPEDVILIPGLGEAVGKIHAAGCLAAGGAQGKPILQRSRRSEDRPFRPLP